MSLLTPELVSVKIYKSTDTGAPVLANQANAVAEILKACLVTGYDSKAGAGWTLAFEDLTTKTKIFNVKTPVGTNFYLRVYNDTGKLVNIQFSKNATSASVATKVIECSTKFNYLSAFTTGAWTLIASDRGFWFFAPITGGGKSPTTGGVYLFAGVVAGTSSSGFLIKHTAGNYSDDDYERYAITANISTSGGEADGGASKAVLYNFSNDASYEGWLDYICDGMSNYSSIAFASPLYIKGAGDVYQLPIYSPSRNDLKNFDVIDGTIPAINFCTSSQYRDDINNSYVLSDKWAY